MKSRANSNLISNGTGSGSHGRSFTIILFFLIFFFFHAATFYYLTELGEEEAADSLGIVIDATTPTLVLSTPTSQDSSSSTTTLTISDDIDIENYNQNKNTAINNDDENTETPTEKSDAEVPSSSESDNTEEEIETEQQEKKQRDQFPEDGDPIEEVVDDEPSPQLPHQAEVDSPSSPSTSHDHNTNQVSTTPSSTITASTDSDTTTAITEDSYDDGDASNNNNNNNNPHDQSSPLNSHHSTRPISEQEIQEVENLIYNSDRLFVTFDLRYGRLNNHVWSFLRALDMAKHLNRTLLVLPSPCANYDMGDIIANTGDGYYDFIMPRSFIDLSRLNNGNPIKYFTQKTNRPYRSEFCTHLPPDFIRVPLRPGKSIDMHSKSILKELATTTTTTTDRLVAVNVPFRWRLDEKVTTIWSHLTFPHHLLALAQEFKETHVGNRKMIGVHLRNLEGKCKNRAKGYARDKFVKEAGLPVEEATRLGLVFCDTNHGIVERVAAAHGLDINSLDEVVVFVASDGQRSDLIETFTSKGGVAVSKPLAESLGSGPAPIVLDMILLTMSDLFIGSPYSTLAVNVRDYRIGNSKGTNWLGLENPFIFIENH